MLFARFALFLAVCGYGLFGFWLAIAPERMEEWIGVAALGAEGRTELRAFYGGIEIGLTAFLLICMIRRQLVKIGCGCLALVSGGVAATRIAGMMVDDTATTKMLTFLAVDGGLAVFGAIGWLVLTLRRNRD